MALEDELASDDPRVALRATQRKLAADMAIADPNVSAQIAGQLRQVIKDLAGLGGEDEESPVDEIAKRRADRIAGSNGAVGASDEGGKQRSRRR